MADQITSITSLPVDEITVVNRLRPASEAGVAALKASIEDLRTMKHPLHVRKKNDGTIVLLSGLHRLTAAKELGWETVPVVAWRCNDDFARLMEIDDNLAGAELTALDTAVFLAERKAVYERMHPGASRGAVGRAIANGDHTDMMSVRSFATVSAEKFNMSERQVFRLIAAGSALDADTVALLREGENQPTLADLQTIAKIEPAMRYRVCAALAGGEATSAAKAMRQIKAQPGDAMKRPNDVLYRKLADTFARAPMAVRRRFVSDNRTVLADLLRELEEGETVENVPFQRSEGK